MTERTPPAVSIIVPVYKTAEYLPKCVDSILAQSFRDFELLLMDDGSPDESGEICDRYVQLDSRVQVIHKENAGVSSARNLGLDRAKGDFVVFVDSDDYIGENYLKDMMEYAYGLGETADSSIVICDYQPFSEAGVESRIYPEPFAAKMEPGGMTVQQFRDLVFGFIIFPPYCKLYSRTVIEENGLRFDTELKSAEDFDFNLRYLEAVDRVCYIPSVQYFYRVGYKKYRPSNHGVLGRSEIKSVHIMANGITGLAKELDLYQELQDEICIWAAKKQYFNRLPMLFADSKDVGVAERRRLYKQLTADPVYRQAYKKGISLMDRSTTKQIGSKMDCFAAWWVFYKLKKCR